MPNADTRVRKLTNLRTVPASVLFGLPYPLKRCDALGCEDVATHHCSGHGVHFCRKHFEEHKADWHCGSWEHPGVVARA